MCVARASTSSPAAVRCTWSADRARALTARRAATSSTDSTRKASPGGCCRERCSRAARGPPSSRRRARDDARGRAGRAQRRRVLHDRADRARRGGQVDARRGELLRVDLLAGHVHRDRIDADGGLVPVRTYRLPGTVGAVTTRAGSGPAPWPTTAGPEGRRSAGIRSGASLLRDRGLPPGGSLPAGEPQSWEAPVWARVLLSAWTCTPGAWSPG
jgi:hypothetical protein